MVLSFLVFFLIYFQKYQFKLYFNLDQQGKKGNFSGERAKQSSYLGLAEKCLFVCDHISNQMLKSILTRFCTQLFGCKILVMWLL